MAKIQRPFVNILNKMKQIRELELLHEAAHVATWRLQNFSLVT